jgi:hypothetical protein
LIKARPVRWLTALAGSLSPLMHGPLQYMYAQTKGSDCRKAQLNLLGIFMCMLWGSRGGPCSDVGDDMSVNRTSSRLGSPGDDAVDETSEVLENDLPGIPGRRPVDDRFNGGWSERSKFAMVYTTGRGAGLLLRGWSRSSWGGAGGRKGGTRVSIGRQQKASLGVRDDQP